MSDRIVSTIRTVVPALVAYLLTLGPVAPVVDWLASAGADVGVLRDQATAIVTAVVLALYYYLARVVEGRWPSAGALLGYARQPVKYAAPANAKTIRNEEKIADAHWLG